MISDPVNERGIQFFYEDSGPPSDAVYTTLVLIHGTSYHSAVFHKLLPLAPSLNLRLVLVNRRDYPGSSYTTPSEIATIRSPNRDVQAEALKDLGVELAQFLVWYVKTSGVPRISHDGKDGGVAVLAWSSGNATCCSMIANLDHLSEREQEVVREALRTYIIYDSPCFVFGIPSSPDIYNPWTDPTIPTMELKTHRFNTWVTAYYHHPNPGTLDFSGLAKDGMPDPPPEKTPTIVRLDVLTLTYPESQAWGDGLVQCIDGAVYRKNVRRMFGREHREGFPRLKMKLVWCRETIPEIAWGAYWLKRQVGKWAGEERGGRELEMYVMEGNHFAHWDLPEGTLKFWGELA